MTIGNGPPALRRIYLPGIIDDENTVFCGEVERMQPSPTGLTKLRLVDGAEVSTITVESLFEKDRSAEAADLRQWFQQIHSHPRPSIFFLVPAEFEFGEQMPWAIDRNEAPADHIHINRRAAVRKALLTLAQKLDDATFGWQRKKRLYDVLLSTATCSGLDLGSTRTFISIARTIAEGCAADAPQTDAGA